MKKISEISINESREYTVQDLENLGRSAYDRRDISKGQEYWNRKTEQGRWFMNRAQKKMDDMIGVTKAYGWNHDRRGSDAISFTDNDGDLYNIMAVDGEIYMWNMARMERAKGMDTKVCLKYGFDRSVKTDRKQAEVLAKWFELFHSGYNERLERPSYWEGYRAGDKEFDLNESERESVHTGFDLEDFGMRCKALENMLLKICMTKGLCSIHGDVVTPDDICRSFKKIYDERDVDALNVLEDVYMNESVKYRGNRLHEEDTEDAGDDFIEPDEFSEYEYAFYKSDGTFNDRKFEDRCKYMTEIVISYTPKNGQYGTLDQIKENAYRHLRTIYETKNLKELWKLEQFYSLMSWTFAPTNRRNKDSNLIPYKPVNMNNDSVYYNYADSLYESNNSPAFLAFEKQFYKSDGTFDDRKFDEKCREIRDFMIKYTARDPQYTYDEFKIIYDNKDVEALFDKDYTMSVIYKYCIQNNMTKSGKPRPFKCIIN